MIQLFLLFSRTHKQQAKSNENMMKKHETWPYCLYIRNIDLEMFFDIWYLIFDISQSTIFWIFVGFDTCTYYCTKLILTEKLDLLLEVVVILADKRQSQYRSYKNIIVQSRGVNLPFNNPSG